MRGRIWSIVAYAAGFEVIRAALLAPMAAGAVDLALRRWGRASVGNFEIAQFVLSPAGLAGLLVAGALAVATIYLELTGLMRMLGDRRVAWWNALGGVGLKFPRVVELGLRQVGAYGALAVPAAIGAALVKRLLWRGRDIYVLLQQKPPVFWTGVGIVGALLAAGLAVAAWLFVRWVLALPVVLFEPGTTAPAAMGRSRDLTRGRRWKIAGALLLWLLLQAGLTAAVAWAIGRGSDAALDRVDGSLNRVVFATGVVLTLGALVAAAAGVVGAVTFAWLNLRLYRAAAGERAPGAAEDSSSAIPAPVGAGYRKLAGVGVIAGAAVLGAGVQLADLPDLDEAVELTAHRAGKLHAPENTIAAMKRAIADGADWAEIDVQRTSDGALVILHDTELTRIGGPRREVRRTTLEEIRAIDAGSWFSPEFAGERIPTLAEMLDAAGAEIGVNIELKPHNRADVEPLVRAVMREVQTRLGRQKLRVCSQSYDGMRLAKSIEPKVEVGFIAGAALGDLSRLEVDFLMVNERMATRRLVDEARAHRMAVHPWTVTDPDVMVSLVDRGVANVITDDVAAMRRRLEELESLDPAERVLLRTREAIRGR